MKWASDLTLAQVVGTWLGEARETNESHGLGWFEPPVSASDDPLMRKGVIVVEWDTHGSARCLDGHESPRSFSLTFEIDLDHCRSEVTAVWTWHDKELGLRECDSENFWSGLFPMAWAWLHAQRGEKP